MHETQLICPEVSLWAESYELAGVRQSKSGGRDRFAKEKELMYWQ